MIRGWRGFIRSLVQQITGTSGVMRKILVIVVNENLKDLLKDIKAPTYNLGDEDTDTHLYG